MEAGHLTREELLEAARERMELPGTDDVSAKLAGQNLAYGIGKLLHVVGLLTRGGDVRFYGSMDFTITRSSARWGSGFAYGGLITVQTGSIPVVFPEIRPNTCGTLVGRLPGAETSDEVLHALMTARGPVTERGWDYGRKNHFVNVYASASRCDWVFVIHGCPARLRADRDHEPGLYIEHSPYWQSRARRFATPLGPISALLGQDAHDFWELYRRCEVESKRERAELADRVFGNYELVSNETHEGMLAPNRYVLGCHAATDAEAQYPLMTVIGGNALLVSASEEESKLSHLGILSLIPHGTGYDLSPLGSQIDRVVCGDDGQRVFVVRGREGDLRAYGSFAHVPFLHRRPEIAHEWAEQGGFRVRETLVPELLVKL